MILLDSPLLLLVLPVAAPLKGAAILDRDAW